MEHYGSSNQIGIYGTSVIIKYVYMELYGSSSMDTWYSKLHEVGIYGPPVIDK